MKLAIGNHRRVEYKSLEFRFYLICLVLANAIKCWKCSSEFPYTFCNDPFSPHDHQKRWAYVECVPSQDEMNSIIEKNLNATCRKLKLLSKFVNFFFIYTILI